jgi:antitoxin MazE
MKGRIIRIGNSRGVRLPKPVIEGAGLQEHVEIHVRGNTVVIGPRKRPRVGWAAAAEAMRRAGHDKLLDPSAPTRFDQEEWRWR